MGGEMTVGLWMNEIELSITWLKSRVQSSSTASTLPLHLYLLSQYSTGVEYEHFILLNHVLSLHLLSYCLFYFMLPTIKRIKCLVWSSSWYWVHEQWKQHTQTTVAQVSPMVYLCLLAPATQYDSARYSTLPSSSLSPPLLTLPFSSFSLHLPPHPFPSLSSSSSFPPPYFLPPSYSHPPSSPSNSSLLFPPPSSTLRIECLPGELLSMYCTMYTVSIEAVYCVVNQSANSLQRMPYKVNV